MNKTQEQAVFLLFYPFLVVGCILISRIPSPFSELLLLVIMVLSLILFIKEPKDKRCIDERDKLIKLKACNVSLIITFIIAYIAAMTADNVLNPDAVIRVRILDELLMWGFLLFMLVRSIAILVQYRRGGKENE